MLELVLKKIVSQQINWLLCTYFSKFLCFCFIKLVQAVSWRLERFHRLVHLLGEILLGGYAIVRFGFQFHINLE